MMKMALQNSPGFPLWFKPHKAALATDPLLSQLSKHRNYVVHQGMLVPNSKAMIGITEGRGLKLAMGFALHPLEDSDDGMKRYLQATKGGRDVLDLLMPDEDSLPCVEREWRLPNFESEVVETCAAAWLRMGETIVDVIKWLGGPEDKFSLACMHATRNYRVKTYNRETLRKWQGEAENN